MRIVIKDLPRYFTLVSSTRPKYFKEAGKLPKSLENKIGEWYEFRGGLLYDIHRDELVLSNPKEAGESKTIQIKGNLLWAQPNSVKALQIKKAHIGEIKKYLVNVFIEELKKLERIKYAPSSYPLKIKCDYIVKTFKDEQDIDNLDTFYRKSFLDAIQHTYYDGKVKVNNPVGFIPEDSPYFVNGIASEVNQSLKVRSTDLIINIYEHDKIILANKQELIGLDY